MDPIFMFIHTDYQKDEILFTIRLIFILFDNVSDEPSSSHFKWVMTIMYEYWTQNNYVVPNRESI